MSQIILTAEQIEKKLRRIAFEIYEKNYDARELCLIGIHKNGYEIASRISEELKKISELKTQLCGLKLNKEDPLSEPMQSDYPLDFISNKVVILIDDVAHSGKTLMYALKPLMEQKPIKIQIAVLVDRKHKRFPVTADYVGLLLSTGAHEMVKVRTGSRLSAFVE